MHESHKHSSACQKMNGVMRNLCHGRNFALFIFKDLTEIFEKTGLIGACLHDHTKIYRQETIKQNWTFRAKFLRREVNSTSNITNFPIKGLRLKLFLFSGSKGSYIVMCF